MTLRTWDWQALSELSVRLLTAFVLGALIGFERQLRQRTAGLRSNTLVALGAAIFVSLGTRLFEQFGGAQTPIHIVAYVVSGIGFLGAGAIMKEGANISGLIPLPRCGAAARSAHAPELVCRSMPQLPRSLCWSAIPC